MKIKLLKKKLGISLIAYGAYSLCWNISFFFTRHQININILLILILLAGFLILWRKRSGLFLSACVMLCQMIAYSENLLLFIAEKCANSQMNLILFFFEFIWVIINFTVSIVIILRGTESGGHKR